MNRNTLIIKSATAITNGSAAIKVCKYKKDEGFVPVYGWLLTGLTTDAEKKITINLDREGVLDTIKGLQDTLPFGCTLSVEFPLGTIPMYVADMYHTSMSEALHIIQRSNLDVSTNDITDLRIEGSKVVASFRGVNTGEFELYEIRNSTDLDNAVITGRHASTINAGNTRLDIDLGHTVDSNTAVLGRWRTNGEILFSPYITARQAHTLKSAVIERHEIRNGKLMLYIYDRDTLGAFYESGLVVRIKQASSNTNFIVSGVSTNLPNRTLVSIDNTDTDRIVALGGTVDISVELIGSTITSNVYSFNTNGAIPVVPTPGAGGSGTSSGKYLKLNADKVAFDEDAGMIYLAFDSSHDAEIEMLQLDTAGSTINLDTTSFALTDRQINVKPTFGFWVKTSSNINQVWSGKISYKYRIKGMVAKTDSVTLSPENPKVELVYKTHITGGVNLDGILKLVHNLQRGEYQNIVLKDIFIRQAGDSGGYGFQPITFNPGENEKTIHNLDFNYMLEPGREMVYRYSVAGRPFSASTHATKANE